MIHQNANAKPKRNNSTSYNKMLRLFFYIVCTLFYFYAEILWLLGRIRQKTLDKWSRESEKNDHKDSRDQRMTILLQGEY